MLSNVIITNTNISNNNRNGWISREQKKTFNFFKEKNLKNASTYYNFLWRFVYLKSFHT